MKRELMICFVLLVAVIPLISSAMDPIPAFCEHQGYTYMYDEELEDYYCIFEEHADCLAVDFYEGRCGQDFFLKEFPCRQEGEFVFSQFEKCCKGLSPDYSNKGVFGLRLIGQNRCVPTPNWFVRNVLYTLWFWLIILFVFGLLIYFLIKFFRKKK